MSHIDKMMKVPDEVLESIVGGAFSDADKAHIVTVSQQLKKCGYPFNNAMAWWHEQAAGYRFSDKEWQEIEGIVRSVYES